MKNKWKLTNLIIFIIFITPILSTQAAQVTDKNLQDKKIANEETVKIYRFNQSKVFVFGRCRSIYNFGEPGWTGELYRGNASNIIAQSHGTSSEFIFVLYYNETTKKTFFRRTTQCSVEVNNSYGLFYWGYKNKAYINLAPRIFIHCYADGASFVDGINW